jgi:ferric-dicitrate binding protein FerR (iron transport regulator)
VTPHVAPHRWADLWAGRVEEPERAEMENHARSCRACHRVRQRVTRASDSFVAIRSQPPPDMPWDAVRARVHWSVSTERRSALRQRRPAMGWLAGALTAGVAVSLLSGRAPDPLPDDPRTAAARIALPGSPPEVAAALIGLVSRASGDVMVDGVRPADLFARTLGAGTKLATGDGRVDVQFGDQSAFALGPRSTIELRRFDAQTIELALDGTVDIAVARRGDHQRFVVIAGDRSIEVHGTQFRVTHDAAATSVSCRHGLVAVRDAHGVLEIGAASRVRVAAGTPVASEHIIALSDDELAQLSQATPLAVPWDPAALAKSSAPLEVATSGHRDVRVDGIELGLAPLRVRVMPGRHTVEAADSAGRFRRAGWVDVAAEPRGARLEIPAEPSATGGVSERSRQLHGRIDRPRLARCMRSIAKAGLTGTYVQIEIAVDTQGAVGFLNVLDTDLPSATASCVRDVLADVRFGGGAQASWHDRIDL